MQEEGDGADLVFLEEVESLLKCRRVEVCVFPDQKDVLQVKLLLDALSVGMIIIFDGERRAHEDGKRVELRFIANI